MRKASSDASTLPALVAALSTVLSGCIFVGDYEDIFEPQPPSLPSEVCSAHFDCFAGDYCEELAVPADRYTDYVNAICTVDCFDDLNCPVSEFNRLPGACVDHAILGGPFTSRICLERCIQIEQTTNHVLYLRLVGRASANHGLFDRARRILVYACAPSTTDALPPARARVVTLPCVAALPPSFIDFVLSRNLADGVAISGCAEGDCYYRLGGEWMQQRIDGERDPYLRNRVDRERLRFWRHRACGIARKQALAEFSSTLKALPKNRAGGRPADA